MSVRKIYVLSITLAIIAAFTSFFSNEAKAILFLFAIIMDAFVNKYTALKSSPLWLLLVFYFISFFYVFVLGRGHFMEMRNILLSYSLMLMCFWIAPGLTRLDKSEAAFIWNVFLVCLVENLIATAIIGRTSPWIIRYSFSVGATEADNPITQAYSQLGLLSYQSAHLLATLCAFFVVIAFEVKKFWKKVWILFMALLAVYVMYLMTITTSLLLGITIMAAVTIFYISKGNRVRFIVSFTLLGTILISTGTLTNWLFLSSQSENYELAEKLNDVGESIASGRAQGQMASRESENDLTWVAIARNPILGGAHGPEDTGLHALVFDYWAWYGVFSLLLFVGWWKEVKRMKRILDRKKWHLYLLCLLPIIILCFLKGPVFLPGYIFATIVILRVGLLALESEAEHNNMLKIV